MRLLLLFAAACAAVTLWTAECMQYQCLSTYDPSSHKGHSRVPPGCILEKIDCPASWKAGVPQGQSKALPLIDTNFIQCHEGFLCCGYVPIDSRTGEVLGHSGVTVGSGVDLGFRTEASLTALKVPRKIIDQLLPYLGLRKDAAACAAIERPLKMSYEDAQQLTEIVKSVLATRVQQQYDRDRVSGTVEFRALPIGVRTAIADVWFNFGFPSGYPKFWNSVIRNDWENAIMELRNFYTRAVPSGYTNRRNDEADILQAALAQRWREKRM